MSHVVLGRILCIATLALVICFPVHAYASKSFQGCLDVERMNTDLQYMPNEEMYIGYCMGIFQGMRDMATVDKVNTGGAAVCVPSKIKQSSLVTQFNRSRFAVDHDKDFQEAVLMFFVSEYGCK